MCVSQLLHCIMQCDIISNRLWCHQENVNWLCEMQGRYVKHIVFIVIYGFIMSYEYEMIYVLSWQIVSAFMRGLFWSLFPPSLHNSRNKDQNNPLMSTETVHHLSPFIILYVPTAERRYPIPHTNSRTMRCLLYFGENWRVLMRPYCTNFQTHIDPDKETMLMGLTIKSSSRSNFIPNIIQQWRTEYMSNIITTRKP